MTPPHLPVLGQPTRPAANTRAISESIALEMGQAVRLLVESGRGQMPLAAAGQWLRPAIMLRQIRFLYRHDGLAVGYVMWAYVSDEVLARLRGDPLRRLDLDEWNEGLNLWVLDLVTLHRPLPWRAILRELFADRFDLAHGARYASEGVVGRPITLGLARRTPRSAPVAPARLEPA